MDQNLIIQDLAPLTEDAINEKCVRVKTMLHIIAIAIVLILSGFDTQAPAQFAELSSSARGDTDKGVRLIPERIIPVPPTVSPELQRAIAQPVEPNERFWSTAPKSVDEWRELQAKTEETATEGVRRLLEEYPVKVENRTIAGVNVFVITPESIPEQNRNRIFLHFHGGAYVFYGGQAGIGEAILMAFYGNTRTVSVDYRMPPNHPFPAALDDAVAVYKEILKTYSPTNVAIVGTSSGGGLAAAVVLKLRDLNVPVCGAVGLGTPWIDLTRTGDTLATNEKIDDVLVTYGALIESAAKLYAGSFDLKHPFLSPIYGDVTGFPPTILTSGTRDLLLSCTVRMHRKLRQAGIPSELQIFEGMSHAEYLLIPDLPEGKEAFQEIARFFDAHLGK
jgi:epsilon-lactone hydrolase